MQEPTPDEALALLAIQRLQAAYGDAVTRRAWDDVRAMFASDAVLDIDTRTPGRDPIHLEGREEIVGFVEQALEQFAFFEFVVLNAVADVDGADGHGRVYISEIRHGHDGQWTQAFGLYQDRYRRRDGRWSITHRRYASLARRGAESASFEMPPIDDWPGWPA